MPMHSALPCITVFPRMGSPAPAPTDPLAALTALLDLSQREGQDALREMTGRTLATFVAEGRHFRATPEGQRWLAALKTSGLAQNGWMLWTMLDLDRLIAEADPLGDRPADMLADLIAQLGQTSLADLVTLVSDLSIEGWRHAAQ